MRGGQIVRGTASDRGVALTTIEPTHARTTATRAHALHLYGRGLSTRRLWARDTHGRRFTVPVSDWAARSVPGDESLLARCAGPTLDIGCGPGRLTAALMSAGVHALGVDISPHAVTRARAFGASALCRSIFDAIPGEGRWECALLADGNVGIGGDPLALLTRAGSLLSPTGRIYVEVGPPGTPTGGLQLELENESGDVSQPFPWAQVGLDGLAPIGKAAGLRIDEVWQSEGRWFSSLRDQDVRSPADSSARTSILCQPQTSFR